MSSKPIAWQTIQKQASEFEKQVKNDVWHKLKKIYKTYESQRNVTYHKNKKNTKKKKHQHNTDAGGQAMGEEMRHVQMNRWRKRAAIMVMRQRAKHFITTFH